MAAKNKHEPLVLVVDDFADAREMYGDEETYRFGSDELESGRENPFRCEICEDLDD